MKRALNSYKLLFDRSIKYQNSNEVKSAENDSVWSYEGSS